MTRWHHQQPIRKLSGVGCSNTISYLWVSTRKGVNLKLHFPLYSLLNKVPAFIQQPNREWRGGTSVSSSLHPSPFSWQFQNNKWKVGESAWDLIVTASCKAAAECPLELHNSPHWQTKAKASSAKYPKGRKERLLAKDRVKAPYTQEMNAILFPLFFFFFKLFSISITSSHSKAMLKERKS